MPKVTDVPSTGQRGQGEAFDALRGDGDGSDPGTVLLGKIDDHRK